MMRVFLLALVSCLGSSVLIGAVRFVTREPLPIATPVRVAVLKADHPAGAPLEAIELGEATVPSDLVSATWLSPEDAAKRVGQPMVALTSGAAISAAHFSDLTLSNRTDDCAAAIGPEVDAAAEAAFEKVFATFKPIEEPARDVPSGRVLFLARNVNAGDVLKAGDLRAGEAARELLTASWVAADRRSELVGQQVLADLEEGAPFMWQMLNVPGTQGNCEFEASRATDTARKSTAQRAAAAWVEKESASW